MGGGGEGQPQKPEGVALYMRLQLGCRLRGSILGGGGSRQLSSQPKKSIPLMPKLGMPAQCKEIQDGIKPPPATCLLSIHIKCCIALNTLYTGVFAQRNTETETLFLQIP